MQVPGPGTNHGCTPGPIRTPTTRKRPVTTIEGMTIPKTAPDPKALLSKLVPSVLLNAALPLVLYLVLSPQLGDVLALGIGAAIPVVVTLVGFAVRRRIDPIGVFATVAFAVVLVVLALSGGNPLVLKLHDAVVTGPLGLLLLASAAVGRPLLQVAYRFAASRGVAAARRLTGPAQRRALSALTALLGAIMFLHATLILVLALALPTSTFLAVGRPAGWAFIALGLLCVLTYRNRLRARTA